jgi:SAM-dependent methyltransferase
VNVQSQFVFQEENEIKRLRVQNELLSCYEAPVLAQIFAEGQNLAVLDIGCNNGSKTLERFNSDSVSRVIGLEYNEELASKAQEAYGDGKFSFYRFDVESENFAKRVRSIMNENQIDGFDVIYLSFVLMHLSDVKRLLLNLRPFLKEEGRVFIIEANDAASTLSGDQDGLLGEFLTILKKDPYSGNREVGATVCETLLDCGYENMHVWHDAVSAAEGEKEKKKAIFTTFFTYLREDVSLLLEAEPDNEVYKSWAAWLDSHYETLKRLILRKKSVISMGMKILTCTKGRT